MNLTVLLYLIVKVGTGFVELEQSKVLGLKYTWAGPMSWELLHQGGARPELLLLLKGRTVTPDGVTCVVTH